MKKNTPGWVLGFFPGEEHLLSMTKQLKQKGRFFNADGVIRLQDLHDIEVCVAEVSGVYKNTDMTKINFDHHKGMFGVLSMLKTISNELKYASLDVFQKVKVFFVHAAGKLIVLCGTRKMSYSFNSSSFSICRGQGKTLVFVLQWKYLSPLERRCFGDKAWL